MSHIDWLKHCMAETRDSWSLGGPGAIAEFSHAAQEALIYQDDRTWVSAHGALRFGQAVELARPLAYETLGEQGLWHHGIALCLPEDSAQLPCHTVITPLGEDEHALHPEADHPPLYDLGLGFAHLQFCIHAPDRALRALLEDCVGQSLFDLPELWRALQRTNPHRVLRSALARVEVYGPIQGSPEGPHSHLMEAQLDPSRSHSAAVPIPPGWVPGLTLHPAHPLVDRQGARHSFDEWAYLRFQRWLRQFGRFDYVGEQNRATRAIERGDAPEDFSPNPNAGDSAVAILLRKLRYLGFDESALLKRWSQHFDAAAGAA